MAFQPILPLKPFQKWGFEIVGPFKPMTTWAGNWYILVVTNYFMKWVEEKTLPDHTTTLMAKNLFTRIFGAVLAALVSLSVINGDTSSKHPGLRTPHGKRVLTSATPTTLRTLRKPTSRYVHPGAGTMTVLSICRLSPTRERKNHSPSAIPWSCSSHTWGRCKGSLDSGGRCPIA